MHYSVAEYIKYYRLQPHPEGGYYRETYRSQELIPAIALAERFSRARNLSTAIYFLLKRGDFSAFHRLQSDECWHFYAGGRLHIYIIHLNSEMEIIHLGSNIRAGERFQFVVPSGCWFASEPAEGTIFSFAGCTVSPGFDFADFELAKRDELIKLYPQYEIVIKKLTR